MRTSALSPPLVAQIVSRRHPLAFSIYGLVFLLGLVFVMHWYGAGRTEAKLFPGVSPWAIFAWKWMMVGGGAAALLALFTRPRISPHWPDIADLLHIEGIGAIIAAFGLSTYLLVLVHLTGVDNSGPAVAVYSVLIAGHLWRGVQAISNARRLEALTQAFSDQREGA